MYTIEERTMEGLTIAGSRVRNASDGARCSRAWCWGSRCWPC